MSGIIKRTIQEYKYVTKKKWSYKEVGDFWDTVDDYDEIDDETYAYKRRFHDSLKMTTLKKGSYVLDVDCRTGNGSAFFHQKNKISKAYCMSPSNTFLKVCQSRMKKYHVKADFELLKKLPLKNKDKTFDGILCFETVEHISNHVPFLKELNRVLKDDGEVILTMPNILWEPVHWFAAIFEIHHSEGPHRFQTRMAMKRYFKKSGFKVIKEDTTVFIPNGPRWLTRFGELVENITPRFLKNLLFLRHIYILKKSTSY